MRSTIISLSALLLPFVQSGCLSGHSHLKRQSVDVDDFGYIGADGPYLWGNLPDSSLCEVGDFQSPVNLDGSIQLVNDGPQLDIPDLDSAQFSNIGSAVQVFLDGSTTILGKAYTLLQYHLHTPSEHYIDGEYFPLEMHMVNQADDGSLGVIGFLFELSDTTTEILANTIVNLNEITEPGSSTTTGPLDFTELQQHLDAFPLYTYSGSLTTPPCSEGVTFILSQEPLQISPDAFRALKDVLKMNARPIQSKPGQKNLLELACPAKKGKSKDKNEDNN